MQKLYYPATLTSPEIKFSPEENIFFMRGVSCPEDVREMYYPVIEWFKALADSLLLVETNKYSQEMPLKFQIDLAYFNSSSAKFLYDIILELKRLVTAAIPVRVEWYYDEEDIDLQESGADIASLIGMEFVYIPKKSGGK
jgi:hypothetical protein